MLVRTLRRSLRPLNRGLASAVATTPPVQVGGPLSEEALRKIGEKDTELRVAYDELPKVYPEHSHPDGRQVEQAEAFRKRLLYRSKQRGWLEVDLLLGSWATKFLPTLLESQLREYEIILNQETVDLFNMMLGREDIPEHLKGPVMDSIQEFVANSPLGKASVTQYVKVKETMSN